MAQCNFVDNVLHPDPTPLQDEVVVNFELIAGMAASPDYAAKYPGSSEISIGADYTVKLEDYKTLLYKAGVECDQATLADQVIANINQDRGTSTSRIGTTVLENHGLHMSPDRAFQFYTRIVFPDSNEDNEVSA
jgi:hypothetical protein